MLVESLNTESIIADSESKVKGYSVKRETEAKKGST